MTEREAYRILGLSERADPEMIRKRYRELIARVHPDVLLSGGAVEQAAGTAADQETGNGADAGTEKSGGGRPLHDARRINQAYALLRKRTVERDRSGPGGRSRGVRAGSGSAVFAGSSGSAAEPDNYDTAGGSGKWNAPVNPNAYCPREVYGRAEEADGTLIGLFTLARGRYLWSLDEDFHLFLRSIYQCSVRLLGEVDASLGRSRNAPRYQEVLSSLTYLLTQQFIDGRAMLEELADEVTPTFSSGIKADGEVFRLPAMLELTDSVRRGGQRLPAEGEYLYPASLRDHRLYLKDSSGRVLGYLSFVDDRMYYIVIPLFEQRRVQVRIRVSGERKTGLKKGRGKRGQKYLNLELNLLFPADQQNLMPENLNLQIEDVLLKYR